MTKLVDPTDDQLNEAFAVHVCGWSPKLGAPGPFSWKLSLGQRTPNFCASADAVLPFVSKLKEVGIHYVSGDWFVRFWSEDKNCANCDSLPKACVIALLRAHGVEIEFSK